jgi:hypothetical protein
MLTNPQDALEQVFGYAEFRGQRRYCAAAPQLLCHR